MFQLYIVGLILLVFIYIVVDRICRCKEKCSAQNSTLACFTEWLDRNCQNDENE